jgi:hypothetical protein
MGIDARQVAAHSATNMECVAAYTRRARRIAREVEMDARKQMQRIAGAGGAAGVLATVAMLLAAGAAHAVPSFARQTGQACIACHVSFPELTPYGRYFKLSGYTLGKPLLSGQGELNFLPMAAMVQAGYTRTRNNRATDPESGETEEVNPRNNRIEICCASVFLASKLNDSVGGFVQWTYDHQQTDDEGRRTGHSGMDNVDLRIVGRYSAPGAAEPDLIYGATLHNNPTVQDVWNSTPAFGFPFTASELASTPAAAALIDGTLAQQAAGMGAYVFWKKALYAELSLYRNADGVFSWLRAGDNAAGLKGYNPYYRLAYSHDWGPSSIMLGTFGLFARRYPDPAITSSPTDRFRDLAVDAQYQYITDPNTFTAQLTYIHERQDYRASYPVTVATGAGIGAGPAPANARDSLRTFKAKATYYRDRKYGATLARFSTTGSTDAGLYGEDPDGNARGPDSSGWTVELNYLPLQNVRLMAQYTFYNKFNGATRNYDNQGRNAHDNDTLFLNVWVAF